MKGSRFAASLRLTRGYPNLDISQNGALSVKSHNFLTYFRYSFIRAFIIGHVLGYLALLPAFLVFPDFHFEFRREIVTSTIFMSCLYVLLEIKIRYKKIKIELPGETLPLKLGIFLYCLSFVWPIFQGMIVTFVFVHFRPPILLATLLFFLSLFALGPGVPIFLFLRHTTRLSFVESRAFAAIFNMISLGLIMIWLWFFLTHFITYAASHYPSSSPGR